jgi:hypothetical protein
MVGQVHLIKIVGLLGKVGLVVLVVVLVGHLIKVLAPGGQTEVTVEVVLGEAVEQDKELQQENSEYPQQPCIQVEVGLVFL